MRIQSNSFFSGLCHAIARAQDYLESYQVDYFYKLKAAGLDDPSILSEIKRRRVSGQYLALVLLQLHDAGLLSGNIKKSLLHAKLETLEKCVMVIVSFYAVPAISRAKKLKLRDALQDQKFLSVVEILLKNQLLSLTSINALMRVDLDVISVYASIFETLDKHVAVSEDVVTKLFSLNQSTLEIFNDIIIRLTQNRVSTHRGTHGRVMDLLLTPWLFSTDAYEAIWSRVSDVMSSVEFDAIIGSARAAIVDGREPAAADFQNTEDARTLLRFVFFRKKPVIGENEKCLAPYQDELPDDFFCTITARPMTNPVRILGGSSCVYERDAIEDWLKTRKCTDPGTNLPPTFIDKTLLFGGAKLQAELSVFFVEFEEGVVVLQKAIDITDRINAFKQSKGIGVEEKNETELMQVIRA